MTIKAIETQYKGYRFRSRLEARWGVFFDALGIKWGYEVEGYDLDECGYYLPDFIITTQQSNKPIVIEIKPEFTDDNGTLRKPAVTAKELDTAGFMLFGDPFECFCGKEITELTTGWLFYKRSAVPISSHVLVIYFAMHVLELSFPAAYEACNQAAIKAREARFEHGETPD